MSCPPRVVKPSGCMPTSRCQWSQGLGIEIVDSVAPTHPHALFRISPDAHVRQCVRPLCSTRRLRATTHENSKDTRGHTTQVRSRGTHTAIKYRGSLDMYLIVEASGLVSLLSLVFYSFWTLTIHYVADPSWIM